MTVDHYFYLLLYLLLLSSDWLAKLKQLKKILFIVIIRNLLHLIAANANGSRRNILTKLMNAEKYIEVAILLTVCLPFISNGISPFYIHQLRTLFTIKVFTCPIWSLYP